MSLSVVTGATGFIGSQLVRKLLEKGESVRCLVRGSSKTNRLNGLSVDFYTVDFNDINSLQQAIVGADTVYHCAGCISTLYSQQMYQINCENTKRIAEACTNLDSVPTLLFISSLAAGGPMRGKDAPLREEWMTEEPVSVYGKSKLAGEQELRKLSPNLPISIVRPPMVLGPGDPYGILMFKTIQQSGFHPCPGWERKKYTVVNANDVVQTLILAAEKGTRLTTCTQSGNPDNSYQSGLYYVARDENPEYGKLGQIIGQKLGRKWTVSWHFARPVLWMVATISDCIGHLRGKQMYLNRDKVAEAIAGNWICSNAKAKRELGLVVEGDLSTLLDETIADYRTHGLLK